MNEATQNAPRPNEYWATLPPTQLAAGMVERITRFVDHLTAYHLVERWRRGNLLTYGFDPDNNGVSWAPVITGKRGELVRVRVNKLLKLKRSHHTLVINQRPAPQARPAAYDSSATSAVPVANALLDNATGKGGGELSMQLANWYCQDYGAGWVSARWDELAGRNMPTNEPELDDEGQPVFETDEAGEPVLDEQTQQPRVKLATDEEGNPVTAPEGDILIQAHRPDCVVFDVSLDETGKHQWLMLATQRNRYELAHEIEKRLAKKGDPKPDRMRAHIIGASSSTRLDQTRADIFRIAFKDDWCSEADLVWVYELFHLATPIMEKGRYAMLLDGQILADGENPYSELPIYDHCAMRIQGTKHGYSHFFDVLGPQQVADSHITAASTCAENLGIPGIWLQSGTDQGSSGEVVRGLRIIKSMAPPQVIEWSGDSPVKLTQSHAYMDGQMMEVSGVTEIAMGNTESASSGKEAALGYAMAQSNTSDYSASYVQMAEKLFNGVIKRYRAFSTTKRIVQISGRGTLWQAKSFTADTLKGIDSIDVQMGPAIMRTTAGVVETANALLERNMVTRDEYMAMLASGRVEPAFNGPQKHEALIERENEMLMEGVAPEVSPTDNPVEHILAHRSVLDDPEARKNEALVTAVLEHLASHDQVWLETSMGRPTLLMALGIPPHPTVAAQMQAAQVAANGPQGPTGAEAPNANAAPTPNGPTAGQPPPSGAGGGVGPSGEDLPQLPESASEVI